MKKLEKKQSSVKVRWAELLLRKYEKQKTDISIKGVMDFLKFLKKERKTRERETSAAWKCILNQKNFIHTQTHSEYGRGNVQRWKMQKFALWVWSNTNVLTKVVTIYLLKKYKQNKTICRIISH